MEKIKGENILFKMNLPAASRRDIKVEKAFFNMGEQRCFSSNPSSSCFPHRKRMGYLKTIIKDFGGVLITVSLILFAMYFTPNFVETNLSPDGILSQITIIKINLIRIGFGLLGTIVLLIITLYFIKPNLFYLLQTQVTKFQLLLNFFF